MLTRIKRFVVSATLDYEDDLRKTLDDHMIEILNIDHPPCVRCVRFYCETNPERLNAAIETFEELSFNVLMRDG